jgi:putative transposase
MPRIARIVAPDYPHHITQRGNHRLDVFLDDEDRDIYLKLLKKNREKRGLEILAYCLMPNHIHLVAIPKDKSSLSRALADTHMRYAQHVNHRYGKVGHLWQGRFYSCVLDETHTLAAARYVERNPVRGGLVGHALDYKWSSARGHGGAEKDNLLSERWPSGDLLDQWSDLLLGADEQKELDTIRLSTRTGRPLGDETFIEQVERIIKRTIRSRRRGRPRKKRPKKKL